MGNLKVCQWKRPYSVNPAHKCTIIIHYLSTFIIHQLIHLLASSAYHKPASNAMQFFLTSIADLSHQRLPPMVSAFKTCASHASKWTKTSHILHLHLYIIYVQTTQNRILHSVATLQEKSAEFACDPKHLMWMIFDEWYICGFGLETVGICWQS